MGDINSNGIPDIAVGYSMPDETDNLMFLILKEVVY